MKNKKLTNTEFIYLRKSMNALQDAYNASQDKDIKDQLAKAAAEVAKCFVES